MHYVNKLFLVIIIYAVVLTSSQGIDDIVWGNPYLVSSDVEGYNMNLKIDQCTSNVMVAWLDNGSITTHRTPSEINDIPYVDKWTLGKLSTIIDIPEHLEHIWINETHGHIDIFDFDVNSITHTWIMSFVVSNTIVIIRSTNYGDNWTYIADVEKTAIVSQITVTSEHNKWIIGWVETSVILNDDQSYINTFSSSNDGIAWKNNPRWTHPDSYWPSFISIGENDRWLMFFVAINQTDIEGSIVEGIVYLNDDTWTHPNGTADSFQVIEHGNDQAMTKHSVDYDGENTILILLIDGTIKRSEDNGINWVYVGDIVSHFPVLIYAGNQMWSMIGGLNELYFATSDSYGNSWDEYILDPNTLSGNPYILATDHNGLWVSYYKRGKSIYSVLSTNNHGLYEYNSLCYPINNLFQCSGDSCYIPQDLEVIISSDLTIHSNLIIENNTLIIDSAVLSISQNLILNNESTIQMINVTNPVSINGCFQPNGALILDNIPNGTVIFRYKCDDDVIDRFDHITTNERGNCNELYYSSTTITVFNGDCSQSPSTGENEILNMWMIIIIGSGAFIALGVILLSLYAFRYKIFPHRQRIEHPGNEVSYEA